MELRNGTTVGHRPVPGQKPAWSAAFEEGCTLVFQQWTALNLAVQHAEVDDPADRANEILGRVIDWFYKTRDPDVDDLAAGLYEAVEDDLTTKCDDGSCLGVAYDLIKIFNECRQNDFSSIQRLRMRKASGANQSKREVVGLDGTLLIMEGDGSSSDDDDMDEDDEMQDASAPSVPVQYRPAAKPEPVVDEDGFTMVQGRGRRGQR